MRKNLKKIPYGRQCVGKEEVRAAARVLRSDFLTQGPKVLEFEKALAKTVGAKYAVAVSNGTAAIHLAAIALGLGPGDEVITTPNSFLATANAALYVGARPVFADIDPETQCIDPDAIRKKITRRTKAIFFTDFAGHPAELEKIYSMAKKYRLRVVEDAAHALGAVYQGSKIGSGRYADMTTFSFHPVKHITTGEGGAVTTNDRKLYEHLCNLRTHGVTRDFRKLCDKTRGQWYYEMQHLGYNYRLTDLQAAIGLAQLKKLRKFVQRRRMIARIYERAFRGIPHLAIPVERAGCRHVYHLYVIRLQGPLASRRKPVFEELQSRGIGVQVHYIPISSQPYYRRLGYRTCECPEAVRYYESAISIPMHPGMTRRQIDAVVAGVKNSICRHLKKRGERLP
jgi:UDP-4-amino-4,6-dideoxy-N-acetyl-beta-L-altrosamine transaminase